MSFDCSVYQVWVKMVVVGLDFRDGSSLQGRDGISDSDSIKRKCQKGYGIACMPCVSSFDRTAL